MPTKHPLTLLTGASRGMGLALAQQLIQKKHSLLCISRHMNADLTKLAAQHQVALTQWEQDLAQTKTSALRLKDWLSGLNFAQFSQITLINNAGVIPAISALADFETSEFDAITAAVRVGLEAPLLLCSVFLQATDQLKIPRRILNISSGLGRRAMASQATYCAVKAGMDHFTRSMALDELHRPNGAKVCALAPGVIDTDMQLQLRTAKATHFPDVERFTALHATGQLTSPDNAAQRILAYLEHANFGSQPVADIRDIK